MNNKIDYFNGEKLIIDVESMGLHGDAFAVAGELYSEDGNDVLDSFIYYTPRIIANPGTDSDKKWVEENVPKLEKMTLDVKAIKLSSKIELCTKFMTKWVYYCNKYNNIKMYAECGWPVESRFLNDCIDLSVEKYNWKGPYPLHEIASILACANMDPMKNYKRNENELPEHHPLTDVRLSARLLFTALNKLNNKL
jgi:hypothetical protein